MPKQKPDEASKVFHIAKNDVVELAHFHSAAQGAKTVAQVAYNAAVQHEQAFKNKLVEVRASLGITEAEGLGVDLVAGTITTNVKADTNVE